MYQWAHATNCQEKVERVVRDPLITAIECDVLMGIAKEKKTVFYDTPILSHPPHKESDCSVASLLQFVTKRSDRGNVLQKHLKLDFKELEAVGPSLELINLSKLSNPLGKQIFLNADIFPGPGKRDIDVDSSGIEPSEFMDVCLEHIQSRKDRNIFYCFSLGYKCDYTSNEPYQVEDVYIIEKLVQKYRITADSGIGLVLALNARLLAVRPDVFDEFLFIFPHSKILAWTGTGEPPIPSAVISTLSCHFTLQNMRERIDFDCEVDDKKATANPGMSDCWVAIGIVILLAGVVIGRASKSRW